MPPLPDFNLSVSEVLKQPDDERLAAFLAVAHRAGLVNTEPRADDGSRFAEFVRVARRVMAAAT